MTHRGVRSALKTTSRPWSASLPLAAHHLNHHHFHHHPPATTTTSITPTSIITTISIAAASIPATSIAATSLLLDEAATPPDDEDPEEVWWQHLWDSDRRQYASRVRICYSGLTELGVSARKQREIVEWVGDTMFNIKLPTYHRKAHSLPLLPGVSIAKTISGEVDVACDTKLIVLIIVSALSVQRRGGDPIMDHHIGAQADGMVVRTPSPHTSHPASGGSLEPHGLYWLHRPLPTAHRPPPTVT